MKSISTNHQCQRALRLSLLGLLLFSVSRAFAEETIPLDPAVRRGKLPNGLTYFIRHNAKPEKSVELRLAVNAGSVDEDNDQRGTAHLIEHMSFRGTTHYPGDDLIHYLQSLGAAFGPDINAATSCDDTVYQLALSTDSNATVRKGLGILADWANGVTLTPADIDKERKVLIEEWRVGRGANQRMFDKIVPILFKNSPYAERLPIGTKESIEGSSFESIRRFYHDWYRPDNMAVIVVGDVAPAEIEAELIAEFGKIPRVGSPRMAAPKLVPDNEAPLFAIVADKENPYNLVQMVWKADPEISRTPADLHRDLTEALFCTMLNSRLAELQQNATPPFLGAQTNHTRLMVRAKSGFVLSAVVAEGGVESGLAAAYTEVVRVKQHGFTAAELERAKAILLKTFEQMYNERDKTPSATLAANYVNYFLRSDAATGVEYMYEFVKSDLPKIALPEVDTLVTRFVTPRNQIVIVSAVEKDGSKLPTERSLQAVVKKVEAAKLPAYVEAKIEGGLLKERPIPGQLTAAKPLPTIGAMELSFANGVRVVLKPTAFQNDQILLSAHRPGGESVFPAEYNLSAQLASAYLGEAGVGRFTKIELQKLLAAKNVQYAPSLTLYFDGIKGASTNADFETLLQLVYLTFTEPRADETAYSSVLGRAKGLLQSARAKPALAFNDDAQRFLYRNHPRAPNTVPNDAEWATVSFAKVTEVSRSRFANASGYTFEIIGSFNPPSIIPLLTAYLGGLPSQPGVETWRDLDLQMRTGPIDQAFYHGKDPVSVVRLELQTPADWSIEEGHRYWSLGNILKRGLIDKLRLQIGGIYDVQIKAELEKTPSPHTGFQLIMVCAPANVEKLTEAVVAEIKRLQKDGPGSEEIQKEVEAQKSSLPKEATDNNAWQWKLLMIERDGEPLTRLEAPEKLIGMVTATELQKVALKYLNTAKLVRVVLYPEISIPKSGAH